MPLIITTSKHKKTFVENLLDLLYQSKEVLIEDASKVYPFFSDQSIIWQIVTLGRQTVLDTVKC